MDLTAVTELNRYLEAFGKFVSGINDYSEFEAFMLPSAPTTEEALAAFVAELGGQSNATLEVTGPKLTDGEFLGILDWWFTPRGRSDRVYHSLGWQFEDGRIVNDPFEHQTSSVASDGEIESMAEARDGLALVLRCLTSAVGGEPLDVYKLGDLECFGHDPVTSLLATDLTENLVVMGPTGRLILHSERYD